MDGNNFSNRKLHAGFLIIIVTVIELCIVICGGGVWLQSLDYGKSINIISSTNGIEGKSLNIQSSDNTDEEGLFEDTYYKALDLLSEGIYFGTTWLDICPNSQIYINNQIYLKVCSEKYSSVSDIVTPLRKYISKTYINNLMADNFIDYKGDLYVKPVTISKNAKYIGLVSYQVKSKTTNKIIYSVKSKYGALNCSEDCDYIYKNALFELKREGSNWVVSNFEMPY